MELPDDPIDIMHFGLAVEVTNDHAVEPSAGHGSAWLPTPCLYLLSAVCLEKNQLRTPSTKFSAQGRFVCSRGTEGSEEVTNIEIELEGEAEREKKREEVYFS